MNGYRWVVVGLLLVALCSCGAFLAPSKGRWNPLDPTKDASASLSVSDDGYVDSSGTNYFDGTIFYVGDSYRGLLRFPFSQVGADLAHAELEIHLQSGLSFPVEVGVRAILQDWTPYYVGWTQLTPPSSFVSSIGSPGIQVYQTGVYHFDVTPLFVKLGASSIKGLVVESRISTLNQLMFLTLEYGGATSPKLLLWYPKW
jgi:hypothetical protein